MKTISLVCKEVDKCLRTKGDISSLQEYEHTTVVLGTREPLNPTSLSYEASPTFELRLSGSSEVVQGFVVGKSYTITIQD